VPRSDVTCSYWLSKRKRHCLTKSVDGETYCQVHLDVVHVSKLPEVDISKNDTQLLSNKSEVHGNVERPELTPGRCQFWLAKKRRYCKLLISVDGNFCVEHSVAAEV